MNFKMYLRKYMFKIPISLFQHAYIWRKMSFYYYKTKFGFCLFNVLRKRKSCEKSPTWPSIYLLVLE